MVNLDILLREFCHNTITWEVRCDNSKLSPSLTTTCGKRCFDYQTDAGGVEFTLMRCTRHSNQPSHSALSAHICFLTTAFNILLIKAVLVSVIHCVGTLCLPLNSDMLKKKSSDFILGYSLQLPVMCL